MLSHRSYVLRRRGIWSSCDWSIFRSCGEDQPHRRLHVLHRLDDERLVALFAGALAVVYAPFDEDYGYLTLEAFLARKPVVTARDSGGTLEFVEDGTNGFVCEPDPAAVAAAFSRLHADRARARSLGDAGYDRARLLTWDGVIERLVGE